MFIAGVFLGCLIMIPVLVVGIILDNKRFVREQKQMDDLYEVLESEFNGESTEIIVKSMEYK